MENVKEQLISKRFKNREEIMSFLKGKEVIILNNPNHHDYGENNTTFKLHNIFTISGYKDESDNFVATSFNHCKKTKNNFLGKGNSILTTSLRLLNFEQNKESFINSIQNLENFKLQLKNNIKETRNKIKQTEKDIQVEREKLGYLQETGINNFEEPEFLKFQKMNLINKRKYVKQLEKLE